MIEVEIVKWSPYPVKLKRTIPVGCSFMIFNLTEWPTTGVGWYLRAYIREMGVIFRGAGTHSEVLAAFLVKFGKIIEANQGEE